jgi:hypothetical protein
MLRQLLVGTPVSVCNIAIQWAGDGARGADIVANCAREAHSAAIAAIDHRHDCDRIDCDGTSLDGGTFFR